MRTSWMMVGLISMVTLQPTMAEQAGAATSATASSDEAGALAVALKGVKVSLARGLAASKPQGMPISGKFELGEGKLQLSIYTSKGDDYFEVVVDYKTGKVAKVEPITGGDDLAAAKQQATAMAKAKLTLQLAVERAELAHAGYRAVSVVPQINGDKVTATVEMMKGRASIKVDEPL